MAGVALAFCYTALLLGENWAIMRRRWPTHYSGVHCRKPYPEMAFRALGPLARRLTAATLHVMLFGVAVVYLLLAAHILNSLALGGLGWHVGECRMLVVLALALLPVTFLKSPQDFW